MKIRDWDKYWVVFDRKSGLAVGLGLEDREEDVYVGIEWSRYLQRLSFLFGPVYLYFDFSRE